MVVHIHNIIELLNNDYGVVKQRIYKPSNKWRKYKLMASMKFELSNGKVITINKGFKWDLSSVPRFLWAFLPPDGNYEIAALIHDYLYQKQLFNRKFADKEMLLWSNVLNSTESKISFRRLDNKLRYLGVRIFGKKHYKKSIL